MSKIGTMGHSLGGEGVVRHYVLNNSSDAPPGKCYFIEAMRQNDDCVFCKLLSGELEVTFVYQDDVCSAFMDIQPVNPGHVLVVPNRHAPDLADLQEEEGAQIFRVAQQVAAALRNCGLKCEGLNFFLADGAAAGQEVFHVHLHVLPRYTGDGFGLKLPPDYHQLPLREELNQIAGDIRLALTVDH